LLGKKFFKKKKVPVQVDLIKKNWKEQVDKACSSALLFLGTGTCCVVKVAKVSMESEQIVENMMAAIEGVVEVVPKKWANAVPEVKLRIEGSKVEEAEKEKQMMEEEEEGEDHSGAKAVKKKKKKKKGRIHEVRYMDSEVGEDNVEDVAGSEDDGGGVVMEEDLKDAGKGSGELMNKKRKKGALSELSSVKELKKSVKRRGKQDKSAKVMKENSIKKSQNSELSVEDGDSGKKGKNIKKKLSLLKSEEADLKKKVRAKKSNRARNIIPFLFRHHGFCLICFIFCVASCSPRIGVLNSGMPVGPYLYANDLNDVLKKKHASGGYKSLVFYLEACESGSIFEGLLPEDINIYATTASNTVESSWGTYCYSTCLGDLYSISWMEDSDTHNLRTETLHQQYKLVKDRTLNGNAYYGSHVMQYGDVGISENLLFQYLGTNPANDNYTFVDENSLRTPSKAVNQRDADLIHFWEKFRKAPEGSSSKITAQKQVVEVMSHRMHIDNSVKLIGNLLFGTEKGPELLSAVRPAGKPLVDDWDCLKNMVRTFETHCGSLSQYGMKHMRTFANICDAGIHKDQMDEATAQACVSIPSNPWSSLERGFSA
ncbi:hypothetical protein S245_057447, partial [Arachis hypogaea]